MVFSALNMPIVTAIELTLSYVSTAVFSDFFCICTPIHSSFMHELFAIQYYYLIGSIILSTFLNDYCVYDLLLTPVISIHSF